MSRQLLVNEMADLFESLVNDNIDGMVYQFFQDSDGKFSMNYISDGVSQLYNVTPNDVKDDINCLFNQVHPDDLMQLNESIMNSFNHNINWDCKYRIITNGQIKHLHGRSKIQKQDDGSCIWNGVVLDITETQLELEKMKLFESLINNNSEGMLYQLYRDKDGKFIMNYISDGVRGLCNKTPEEVKENVYCMFDLIHPDDLDRVNESIIHSFTNNSNWECQYRIVVDGKEKYVHGKATIEKSLNGTATWNGLLLDVTQLKVVEQELAAQTDFFNALADQTNVFYGLLDINGSFEYLSPSSLKFLGYSLSEIKVAFFKEIVHPDHQEIVRAHIARVIEKKSVNDSIEHKLITKGQDIKWVKVILSYIQTVNGPKLAAVAMDTSKEKEQELRLKGTADNMDGAIYEFRQDSEGNHTVSYISEGIKLLYDISSQEIYQNSDILFQVIHSEDLHYVLEKVKESYNENKNFQAEFRIIINGIEKWIASRSKINKYSDGSASWHGILSDITKQKARDHELKEMSQKLQGVNENIDGMVYQFKKEANGNYCMTYVTDGVKSLYGVEPSVVLNDLTPLFSCVHPDDVDKKNQTIRDSYNNNVNWDCNFRIIIDGQVKHLHGRSKIQKNHDGSAVWNGVILDVTRTQKLEKELKEKYHQLDFIGKNVPGMVSQFMQSLDGKESFLFVSEGSQGIYGIGSEEIMANISCYYDLIHKDDIDTHKECTNQSAKTLGLWDCVYRVNVNGQIKTLHGRAVPSKKADGAVIWDGITIDITLQKKLEEDLVQSEKEADRERLENQLKTEFLGDISHELRTPLNAINGFSELLLDGFVGGTLNEKQTQYLQEIHKGGAHLLRLINSLIDYTIIEQDQIGLDLRHINISNFILDLKKGFVPMLLSKKISLVINDLTNGLMIMTDATKLQQILTNIVDNSIQHSTENSEIIINLTKQSKTIQIGVIDFGEGISKSKQAQLFNSDFIKKQQKDSLINNGKGKGFGLSITKHLVELMHGEFFMFSDGEGQGVTVQLCFPIEK